MEPRATASGGAPAGPGAGLAGLLQRTARRWWLVALALVAGLLVGLALLAVLPKTYAATAAVLVTPVGQVAGSATTRTAADVNLDTEAQVVASSEVAGGARTLLRSTDDVGTLQDDVSVAVPPNSSILSITFTTGTASGAQRGAHAFAQAYLDNRAATAKQQVDAAVAGLQTQLDADQKQLLSLTGSAAGLAAGSPDRVYADARISIIAGQVNTLAAQLAATRTAASTPGQIITDATLPGSPSSPSRPLVLAGCGVLGLLLGLAVAVLASGRDRGLRGPADVRRLTGLVLLGTVQGSNTPGTDPDGPRYDRLRNAVVGGATAPVTVQVCGDTPRGASAVVALDLARSVVRQSEGVVLICAHPDSALPELTDSTGRPGLSDVLRGEATLDGVQVPVAGAPGVVLVPPGRAPSRLEDLLQSPTFAELLRTLRTSSSVVLETAGPDRSAGAQSAAGSSDAVVLLAARGRTDARAVRADADAVRRMGGRVAGLLLVERARRPGLVPDDPAPLDEVPFTEPATRA